MDVDLLLHMMVRGERSKRKRRRMMMKIWDSHFLIK
jgi:hypothetical protein